MARTKSKTKLERSARTERSSAATGEDTPNPGFMLLGLIWIIVFYVSQNQYPIPALGAWNILVGFGIAFIGFLMTTRWR